LFVEMALGRCPPSVDLDDSEDDSDVLAEFTDDPQIEKFKTFSDTQLDDEITKYEGYLAGGPKDVMRLPDGGAKLRKTLQKLEQVKRERAKGKRSPVVRLFRAAPRVLIDRSSVSECFSS
jgi:hypothetical protein